MKKLPALVFLSVIILSLIAPIASANVFEPAQFDKSRAYLGMLFGSNVGNIALTGDAFTPVYASPLLINLFEKLNLVVVSIAAVILSYIGIVSTINTAQEGQVMGKKWSSIWLPMRAAVGMLLMVPTPGSGYSMIQVTMMWCIIQSIGAADQIWNIILDNLQSGISMTGGVDIDAGVKKTLQNQGKDLAKSILQSAVCVESLKRLASGGATGVTGPHSDFITKYGSAVRLYQQDLANSPKSTTNATMSGYLNIGVRELMNSTVAKEKDYATICGKIKVDAKISADPDLIVLTRQGLSGAALESELQSRAINAYYQKMLALNTMYANLKPLAQAIVNETVRPRNSDGTIVPKVKHSPEGYIAIAGDSYRDSMTALIRPATNDAVTDVVNKGKSAGWIVAGSFYFALNSAMQQTLLTTASVVPEVQPFNSTTNPSIPSCPDSKCKATTNFSSSNIAELVGIQTYLASNTAELKFIALKLLDAENYYNDDKDVVNSGKSLGLPSPGGSNALLMPLQQLTSDMVSWLADEMQKDSSEDPLLGHAQFGSRLMQGAEYTWMAVLAASILIAILSSPGAACSPGFMMVASMLMGILPPILAVIGILWTLGATLAVYTPMIPYMIYTTTAMGWFILVIEAMVAAPMVSLTLVIPSGEELGKAGQSLMLLLNILLRPTLMLFGFVLAAKLYRAVINLVNYGMADTMANIPMDGSLLAPIAAMGLYIGFVTALANKCFILIPAVADKLPRWWGGPSESTDTSAVQDAEKSMGAAAGHASQAGTGAASGAAKGAKEKADKSAKDKAASDAASKGEEGKKALEANKMMAQMANKNDSANPQSGPNKGSNISDEGKSSKFDPKNTAPKPGEKT